MTWYGLGSQLLTVAESSGYSPLALPLYLTTLYFRSAINALSPTRFFILLPLSTTTLYWLHGLLYWFIIDKPKSLAKYKHQKKFPLTPDFNHLCRIVLRNQLLIWFPCCLIMGQYDKGQREETSLLGSCVYIVLYVLLDEVVFFYTHWACHKSTFLYQHIHKQHHLHSAPFALASDYAHWMEHLVVNILPPCIGFFIVGGDYFTFFMWHTQIVLGGQNNHR